MSDSYQKQDEKNFSRYFKVMIVMKENRLAFKIYDLNTIVKIQSYARMITPKKFIKCSRIIDRFCKKWALQKRFNQEKFPREESSSLSKNGGVIGTSEKESDESLPKQSPIKSYKNVLLHLVREQHPQKFIEKESVKKGKSSPTQKKSTTPSPLVNKNKRFEKGKHWCKFGKKCRIFYNLKGFEEMECNFKHIEQAGVNRYPKEHEKCPACIVYKGDCTCCYELLM